METLPRNKPAQSTVRRAGGWRTQSSEFVRGYEASGWFGLGAPRNTSAEIVQKINQEMNAGLADAKLKARFADLGSTVLPGSPVEFGKLIADETEKWAR